MHPLIEAKLPQIAELCRRYHVRRLDLFGSALGERFDPARSDVDFAVEYLPAADCRTLTEYFALRDGLAQIFERNVDLVERAAVRNRYFHEELDETGVPVYAA